MNFDDEDKLKLRHLAGGNIVKHAPVFSTQGRLVTKKPNAMRNIISYK